VSDEATLHVKVRVWVNLILVQVWTAWIVPRDLMIVVVLFPFVVTLDWEGRPGSPIPAKIKVSGELV